MIQLDPAQLVFDALLIGAATMVAISAVFALVLRAVRLRRGLGWLVGWLLAAVTILLCAFIVQAPAMQPALSLAATLTACAAALANAAAGYRFGQRRDVPRSAAFLLLGGVAICIALWWRFREFGPFVAPEFGLAAATLINAVALYPLCRDSRRGGARAAFVLSAVLGLLMSRTAIFSVVLAAQARTLNHLYWIGEVLGGTLLAFFLALGELAAILDEIRIDLIDSHDSLEVAMRNMETAASVDPLTGLHNRYAFYAKMEAFKLEHGGGAIAILDLNNLKPINDTYGHQAGDDALQSVARRLREIVRATDFVCRWGGDEFVVVLNGATLAAARARLSRMEAPEPIDVDGLETPLTLTVSWGIAGLAGDVDAALREADRELYRQKAITKAAGKLAPT